MEALSADIQIMRDVQQWSLAFRYQMLDRLRTGCEYYLGAGSRHSKYLWAGEAALQIAYMKAIWNSFPMDQKPDWLDMDQIRSYERLMSAESAEKEADNGSVF